MSSLKRLPIVVVLGCTGTGKSKLAIDLAKKFNGEIISADSMQIYKRLDILTNKVTTEEMKGVPHHMMSFLEPQQNQFHITQFQNMSLPIIEKIMKESKLPIIVGGTNYYIESLLWKVLIDKSEEEEEDEVSDTSNKKIKIDQNAYQHNEILSTLFTNKGNYSENEIENWKNEDLMKSLEEIDPERAKKVHPNERRKILRSLQIFFRTGKKHSDFIREQIANSNATILEEDLILSKLGGPLRYSNIVCFWIQAPKEILKERIEKRVDEMIEKGLRNELDSYIEILKEQNDKLDFTRGLLQSIGFKEFNSYLQLAKEEKYEENGNKLFNEGISRLKLVTFQYAKRQIKWIRQRFLRSDRRQVPPVFWVDGSLKNETDWDKNVTDIAFNILSDYMNSIESSLMSDRLAKLDETEIDDLVKRVCEECDKIVIGEKQWKDHIHSKHHKKMIKLKKIRESLLINNECNEIESENKK